MKGEYIFKNILDSFVFDKNFNLVMGKSDNLKKPSRKELFQILNHFKDKKYFPDFHKKNIELTKQRVRDSFSDDILIIQATESIDELNMFINTLVKRLREWYAYYMPEFTKEVYDNERFVKLICEGEGKPKKGMGTEFRREDLDALGNFAEKINELYEFKKQQTLYLEKKMQEVCPNLLTIAGAAIGGKLLHLARSLKRLAELPSSTVQLLGAEKALFRHIRNKKYLPPKYGIIHEHQFITKATHKGKAARLLADKISIAARIDFFKGKYIGDKLKKELEEKGALK